MKTITKHLRQHILDNCGFNGPVLPPSLESLKKTEWSTKFERLMRNRMLMGALRYGLLGAKDKPNYDKITSIRQRLDLYEQGGNAEHLVDIANLCQVEFVDESHPNFHWKSEDDGVHAEEVK